MRWHFVGLALAFVACRSALPSSEPLGVGPMADRGDAGAALARAAGAGGRDGGAPASEPESAPTGPVAEAPLAEGGAERTDAASSAASGSADAGAAGDAQAPAALGVAGEYAGFDTTTYRLPNVPEAPQKDPNARTRVVQGPGDAIELVIINSSNGQDLCKLKGKIKAGNVTIDKGQRCFEEDGGMMTATLRKGTARFSGKRLVMDLEFDLEVETGQDTMKGEIIYHFEGDRK